MELQSIVKELNCAISRLRDAEKEVYRWGNEAAATEHAYRKELSKQMLILRVEKMPVTLIGDVARGELADLKFSRDVAANRYRSGFSILDAIKVEINALQSVLRVQSDI